MVLHFEGKNEDMNIIPSNLREHYSQTHFDVKFFYLHNSPLVLTIFILCINKTLILNIIFITLYPICIY